MKSTIPENSAAFSLGEIARLTGGTLSGAPSTGVRGVATDSRVDLRGKLFVALVGERFDGHVFASAALRSGACALLVERDLGDVGVPVVRVASTLQALGAIAAQHRLRWGGKLAAIAGSAGKTTTRSATGAVLDALAPGAVHVVPGNLNNAIGVPMVLLGLRPEQRYAVVEIGTNAVGEVRSLAAQARPDAAVLTVIGLEHTAGLGDLDGVEQEEGSLFQALAEDGIALGNADDARVVRQLERAPARIKLKYGFAEGAEYRVVERVRGAVGASRVRLRRPARPELVLSTPLLGKPGAYALAAGVAVAEALSGQTLDGAAIERALVHGSVGEPGRLVPVALANGAVVLDDTYNSNPASLTSSVTAAAEIARARGGRLLLVLGEMRELGEHSPRLHREAGESLVHCDAARVIAVGGDARWLLEPFAGASVQTEFALDADAAAALVTAEPLSSGDVVLVKASRGVHAERVVEELVRAHGSAQ